MFALKNLKHGKSYPKELDWDWMDLLVLQAIK
jgi:hypothetical protein